MHGQTSEKLKLKLINEGVTLHVDYLKVLQKSTSRSQSHKTFK